MKPVQVISYSGYKADESPRLLKLGDTLLPIAQIEDRWYSPGETFFRVRTQTGDRYLLRRMLSHPLPRRSPNRCGQRSQSQLEVMSPLRDSRSVGNAKLEEFQNTRQSNPLRIFQTFAGYVE